MVKSTPLAHITPPPLFLPVRGVGDRGDPGAILNLRQKELAFLPPALGAGGAAPAPRGAASKGGAAGLLIAPDFLVTCAIAETKAFACDSHVSTGTEGLGPPA